MFPNPLKQKLKAGEIVLGSALPVPSAMVAATICNSNPDFVWIDTEHAPFGTEALDVIPSLIRLRGSAPMIRVAWNDPALIKKAFADCHPSPHRPRREPIFSVPLLSS